MAHQIQKSLIRKDKQEELYFIAIVPPQPVFDETWQLKNYFKEHYQSKASLNSPPHITLHMPFEWNVEKEELLVTKLQQFASHHNGGVLPLLNFKAFPPRVIYVDVVKTEWLENLQKELHRFCKRELNLFNANYKEHAFHPHLTLAFRDLKKQNFQKAWEEFDKKKYEALFSVHDIVLLKHNGKSWQELKSFKLISNI
jgi:2'-5' RNA ligase